jgi:hypothetical protein
METWWRRSESELETQGGDLDSQNETGEIDFEDIDGKQSFWDAKTDYHDPQD